MKGRLVCQNGKFSLAEGVANRQKFTPMLTLLREQSKWLMIFFFTLLFFSFALFFNISAIDVIKSPSLGKIDGKKIKPDDFKVAVQEMSVWFQLQSGQSPDNENMRNQIMRMTWVHLAMVAEADKAGIRVSDTEVIDFIKKLPFFQKEGKYQPDYYQQFSRGFLSAQGINTSRFEQMVRNQLKVERYRETLTGSVRVAPQEAQNLFNRMMGSVKMSVVRIPLTTTGITVTPEEIEKEYDLNQTNPALMTEELRQVAFAAFRLSPADLKAPEKVKSEAKAKLAEKAQEFSTQIYSSYQTKDFAATAQAAGATSGVTEFFSQNGAAKPLAPSVHFNRASFRTSPEDPISPAVELEDGFYVIQLKEVKPATLKPLVEVTPVLQKMISDRKAAEAARTRGETLAQTLNDAVKSGSTFKAAALSQKVSVQDLPEFKPAEPTLKDPDLNLFVTASQELQVGQISGFKPSNNGGMIIFLESRKPGNMDEFKKIQPMIESRLLNSNQSQILNDFMKNLSKNSRYQFPDYVLGSSPLG